MQSIHLLLKKYQRLKETIKELEKQLSINYNDDQEKAITTSLNKNITIITGGPGTGKTTIIQAIVSLYKSLNRLEEKESLKEIIYRKKM